MKEKLRNMENRLSKESPKERIVGIREEIFLKVWQYAEFGEWRGSLDWKSPPIPWRLNKQKSPLFGLVGCRSSTHTHTLILAIRKKQIGKKMENKDFQQWRYYKSISH